MTDSEQDDLALWFADECKKDRWLIWSYRRVHYWKLLQLSAWKTWKIVTGQNRP